MDRWLSLLPASPADHSPGAPPAPDVDWAGEQQRLVALQWHASAARRECPSFEKSPEIRRITDMPLPWKADDLAWALRHTHDALINYDGLVHHLPVVIAEQLPADRLAEFAPVLTAVLDEIRSEWQMPVDIRRPLAERYGKVLARVSGGLPAHLLPAHDRFGAAARARLGDRATDPATVAAMEFATTLTKPVPPKSWLRQAEELLDAAPQAPGAIRDVLATFAEMSLAVADDQDVLLRGLCAMAAFSSAGDTTELLARVAETAGQPRGSAIPKAARTAAALVEILVDRPGVPPARALGRLALTARSGPLRTRVRDALDRMGAVRGWEPGEALELAVDDHGLPRAWPAGDGYTLRVDIVGEKATVRAWRDGKPLKTVPAELRPAAEAPRALAKEVNKTLASERARVENLLSLGRNWDWDTWEARYLRHPVTGTIGRRLIWQASLDNETWVTGLPEPGEGGWTIGGLRGSRCVVRLWHPVLADPMEVNRWRDRLIARDVRQPFKQVYREIYRLTPAEESTRVYSNRFAGHILRYRQANALMRVRGWQATYLGPWDGGYSSDAAKEFAAGEWRATFRHELAGEVTEPEYRVDHCSTDQVRFARRNGRRWEQADMAGVPPRVLSEAMRDVDLFVGVTSIATDEAWADRGEHGFGEYWARASFGELSGSAEVRREVLARLLPRLKIGSRCELTGRFLRVRGTRASYKIHLGSANILMEPDDRYLCIVPGGRATRVSLPFDDDERLSLILSKAFLLADDEKITDSTILRQLPR